MHSLRSLVVAACEIINQVLQRSHLPPVYKLEFLYEVVEVFEAGVKMSLFSQGHNLVEMRVVDMRVDSKQSLEDIFNDLLEVPGERNVHS